MGKAPTTWSNSHWILFKKLFEKQRKYSFFDREVLAAYQAVLDFQLQIEGRHVTLFSDHKPLSLAFSPLNY